MYHNEMHFKYPFEYHPERFLGDPRFVGDNRDALQPFHTGPRNCVGRKYVGLAPFHFAFLFLLRIRTHLAIATPLSHLGTALTNRASLAYAEMRLILARVVFNFDMRIADESRNWIDQKVYNLWKKGPLMVYLTPVRR